jgi:hypothetical protein
MKYSYLIILCLLTLNISICQVLPFSFEVPVKKNKKVCDQYNFTEKGITVNRLRCGETDAQEVLYNFEYASKQKLKVDLLTGDITLTFIDEERNPHPFKCFAFPWVIDRLAIISIELTEYTNVEFVFIFNFGWTESSTGLTHDINFFQKKLNYVTYLPTKARHAKKVETDYLYSDLRVFEIDCPKYQVSFERMKSEQITKIIQSEKRFSCKLTVSCHHKPIEIETTPGQILFIMNIQRHFYQDKIQVLPLNFGAKIIGKNSDEAFTIIRFDKLYLTLGIDNNPTQPEISQPEVMDIPYDDTTNSKKKLHELSVSTKGSIIHLKLVHPFKNLFKDVNINYDENSPTIYKFALLGLVMKDVKNYNFKTLQIPSTWEDADNNEMTVNFFVDRFKLYEGGRRTVRSLYTDLESFKVKPPKGFKITLNSQEVGDLFLNYKLKEEKVTYLSIILKNGRSVDLRGYVDTRLIILLLKIEEVYGFRNKQTYQELDKPMESNLIHEEVNKQTHQELDESLESLIHLEDD